MDPGIILKVVFVIYSIILHEIAHGWVALKHGDETARDAGRLTLNPVPHIDPMGTIIFPLMQLLTAGTVFLGWAKPVPVNPLNLRPRVRGDILVSIAGVVVNLSIATLFAVLWGVPGLVRPGSKLEEAVEVAIIANVALAIFNLLPIPPLDGSHVMKYLLPPDLRAQYERIGFYGTIILLVLIVSGALGRILWPIVGRILFVMGRLRDAVERALS